MFFSILVSLPKNAYWAKIHFLTCTGEEVIGKRKAHWKDIARPGFRVYSGKSRNSISVNTNGLATLCASVYTSRHATVIFSGVPFSYQSEASLNNSAQKRRRRKAARIKGTAWFACTNKGHKLFTGLQSLEAGEVHQGKSRICLFIINYLHSMFYNIRCVEEA